MKRVYAKEEYCMDCRLCQIHCLVQHSKSKNIIKAFKQEMPRAKSRIRVEKNGPISFAVQCRHCDEPACVFSCLTGALRKDPLSGVVKHDTEKCIGCWTCVLACQFGAISMDTAGKKVVAKCDLCPGLAEPACVANCPNEALVLLEAN